MAQTEGYQPVETTADYEGVWMTTDTALIQLFEDEFAPSGSWLIIYDEKSYFSSYLDPEWGASINVGFEYTLTASTFDCRLTESNSLGYFMEHENQRFAFKLFYKLLEGERFLQLVNDFGKSYELVQPTDY